MATRSTIAVEQADGTVKQVYCHWDGYLDHNGKLLLNHYSDPAVAAELIQLGSISSLREQVGEKHGFDDRYDSSDPRRQWTTAYGRDRGESDTAANEFSDFESYCRDHQYEEYEYILRRDGNWYVSTGGKYQLLVDAIAEEMHEKEMEED
jgi:hypothetical protein